MISAPLILGCFWVLAAAVVAMLPMPRQMVPGAALLLAAPGLVLWIGWLHGWLWAGIGLFAFVSMFRAPLLFLARRAWGRPAPLPRGPEK